MSLYIIYIYIDTSFWQKWPIYRHTQHVSVSKFNSFIILKVFGWIATSKHITYHFDQTSGRKVNLLRHAHYSSPKTPTENYSSSYNHGSGKRGPGKGFSLQSSHFMPFPLPWLLEKEYRKHCGLGKWFCALAKEWIAPSSMSLCETFTTETIKCPVGIVETTLVGGFNPFEKWFVKMGIFPI